LLKFRQVLFHFYSGALQECLYINALKICNGLTYTRCISISVRMYHIVKAFAIKSSLGKTLFHLQVTFRLSQNMRGSLNNNLTQRIHCTIA